MKRFDRALALTLLVLALLIVFVLPQLAPSGEEVQDSIASAEPDGRLALALLLERAGFEPEAWRAAPERLPEGPHVLWAARAPRAFGAHFDTAGEDGEEGEDGHAVLVRRLGPDAMALHALAHYRRFVEGGGTLVLPAGERAQEFLRALELDALAAAAARPEESDDEGAATEARALVLHGDDERIDVDWPAGGVLDAARPDAGAGLDPLATLDDGALVAWSAAVGAGRIVVLGDDGFARNGDVDARAIGEAPGIGRRRHALLAVRLVERLTDGAPGARLLFDETALGRWRPETALGLATSGAQGLVLAHLVLLLAVLAWRTTWVREFPRDPEPLERVSPLVRARAQASLYARARRFDLLGAALRRGVLDGVARRLGRRPPRGRAALALEGGEPDGAADAAEAADVRRLGEALGVADPARWSAAFLGPAPASAEELAALGAELAEITGLAGLERAGAHGARSGRRASGIVRPRAVAAGERETRTGETAADR